MGMHPSSRRRSHAILISLLSIACNAEHETKGSLGDELGSSAEDTTSSTGVVESDTTPPPQDDGCDDDAGGLFEKCAPGYDCCGYATEEERICRTFPSGYHVCTETCQGDDISNCPPPPLGVTAQVECYAGGCVLACDDKSDCPPDNICFTFCYPT